MLIVMYPNGDTNGVILGMTENSITDDIYDLYYGHKGLC